MEMPSISDLHLSLLPNAMNPEPQDLRAAAEGFEALFLSELMKGGRASLPGDDLTGSQGVRMAQDMLDMHLARHAAGQAKLGVADAVMRQFAQQSDST